MIGRFIAVVGPSGVGKDAVMTALATHDSRFVLARRVITRPSDAGGESHDGISTEEFERREAAGDFALVWSAHGLRYGIPATVDASLRSGHDVLANLSRSVLSVAVSMFARCEVILLTADRAVLASRLTARRRESADQIGMRLERAVVALSPGINPHVIDNSGELADTVRAVIDILYPVRA